MIAYPDDHVLTEAMKNGLCTDFTTRADAVSLHTDHPGITGANESAITRAALAWPAPMDGLCAAQAAFTGITGNYPWLGLWDGGVFRMAIRVNITNTAPRDVVILITHEVQ